MAGKVSLPEPRDIVNVLKDKFWLATQDGRFIARLGDYSFVLTRHAKFDTWITVFNKYDVRVTSYTGESVDTLFELVKKAQEQQDKDMEDQEIARFANFINPRVEQVKEDRR